VDCFDDPVSHVFNLVFLSVSRIQRRFEFTRNHHPGLPQSGRDHNLRHAGTRGDSVIIPQKRKFKRCISKPLTEELGV